MNPPFESTIHHPPPPPPPLRSRGSPAPPFLPDRRRLAVGGLSPGAPQQPSLATNFARSHVAGASQTPISAVSAHPFSPASAVTLNDQSPSVVSLSSASTSQGPSPDTPTMEPYDPRQWSARGQNAAQMALQRGGPSSARSRPASMVISGNEDALPEPPPPYSHDATETPASAVRMANTWETANFSASPLAAETSVRASPQIPMSPGFPPPPPQQSSRHRERSASGLANQLFSLPGRRAKQPARPEQQQQQPTQMLSQSQVIDARPPASRRAASTGHLNPSHPADPRRGSPSAQPSPENAWQPGMPLPGPPPGPPPPNAARSQSLNRIPSSSSSDGLGVDVGDGARQRRAAAAASSGLGPVPPTPAHWIDSDHPPPSQQDAARSSGSANASSPPGYQPLRINTGSGIDHPTTRRSPRRDNSVQERRSRSRAAKEGTADSGSGSSGHTKIAEVVASPAEGSISRRRGQMRPASGFIDAKISSPAGPAGNSGRSSSQPAIHHDVMSAMSPPLTGGPGSPQTNEESLRRRSALRKQPGSATSDRPIFQLLSARNIDEASAGPSSISPGRHASRPPSSNSARNSTRLDPFFIKAMERHRAFMEKEASASSDEERLELFASFMVHESRLRRDRYAAAYTAMAGDIVDLTRDMWRSYTKQSKRAVTPSTSTSSFEPSQHVWAPSDGQPTSAQGNFPSSASSFGDYTPATDVGSAGDSEEGFGRSESRQWAEGFKPSLSPIPSMAVSTVNDEDSSRGRKSSRWWEDSSGSGSIGNPARIEKSRRETKYMGVSAADLGEKGQASHASPDLPRHTPTPGSSMQHFNYGPNEYPPEKVGWHESADFETPMATPAMARDRKSSSASATSLDVSRLVTLPPPYPRHHPALNNHHPVLADLRNEHRALASQEEIQSIKEAYTEISLTRQTEQQALAKERRKQLRANIQDKIASNSITFAEAAQAEADFDKEESQREKGQARSNFDLFEANVAQPLNALLTERIQKASDCIDKLRKEQTTRNETSDPNRAQEEGDEQPERLEQLTLLKWIFEARETLHKEMFDLHAERSAKYSEVVLTPLRLSNLQAKIDEATAFFRRDAQERQTTFARETATRFAELQKTMELNVSRGVEDQLSAFWDIAPGLLEVIQLVPEEGERLARLEIQIPGAEYEENPAYERHPMQYLFSLLAHAEKSAYQFIESQVNLLCLLHEVRTASAKAGMRVREVEGGEDAEVLEEVRGMEALRERELTADLQDKVGEVERQWRQALGEVLGECKGRVKVWLEESEGWEDGLE